MIKWSVSSKRAGAVVVLVLLMLMVEEVMVAVMRELSRACLWRKIKSLRVVRGDVAVLELAGLSLWVCWRRMECWVFCQFIRVS